MGGMTKEDYERAYDECLRVAGKEISNKLKGKREAAASGELEKWRNRVKNYETKLGVLEEGKGLELIKEDIEKTKTGDELKAAMEDIEELKNARRMVEVLMQKKDERPLEEVMRDRVKKKEECL